MIRELYEQDYSLLEVINNNGEGTKGTLIVKTPYLSSDHSEVIGLEKESFSMDLKGLTSFVRFITNEGYDKYGHNNYYILRGAGHKSIDIVNLLFELQENKEKDSDLTNREKVKIYRKIIKVAKEEIKKLSPKFLEEQATCF